MAKRVTPRTKFSLGKMIAVLWNEAYDEELAVIAVTSLRERGFRVQVVSTTTQRQARGAGEMIVTADLNLTQMYASINQIRYVLLPSYTITSDIEEIVTMLQQASWIVPAELSEHPALQQVNRIVIPEDNSNWVRWFQALPLPS